MPPVSVADRMPWELSTIFVVTWSITEVLLFLLIICNSWNKAENQAGFPHCDTHSTLYCIKFLNNIICLVGCIVHWLTNHRLAVLQKETNKVEGIKFDIWADVIE